MSDGDLCSIEKGGYVGCLRDTGILAPGETEAGLLKEWNL